MLINPQNLANYDQVTGSVLIFPASKITSTSILKPIFLFNLPREKDESSRYYSAVLTQLKNFTKI